MSATSRELRNFFKGIAFISPWIVGFSLFLLLPIILSFYYSFCDYNMIQRPVFVGLANYRLLFHDEVFVRALRVTLYYGAISIPAGLFVSLGVAVLLNRHVVGQPIFRTLVFLPSLVPTIASAILWKWLFNQKLGLINVALAKVYALFHVQGPAWIDDPRWAVPSLALMSVWSVGNTVVIYLAGLQDVPRELYEAADLDGANGLQTLLHVTIPMISPVIFFNLIMAIIGVLQIFDTPFMMTQGGPSRASYFYTYYLYDNAFGYLHMGYASAMAWIQLLIVLVLTGIAFLTSNKWVHYQGK
jgi:multiple sugar transport system permease protein